MPEATRAPGLAESALLRGESAASARAFRPVGEAGVGSVAGRRQAPPEPVVVPPTAAGSHARAAAGHLARPAGAPGPAAPVVRAAARPTTHDTTGTTADATGRADNRRASVAGQRPAVRLGEVYADTLAELAEQARASGFTAGYAEGFARGAEEAAGVVADAESAAADRLGVVHEHWERQWRPAAGALAAAADQLDQTAAPVVDELRDLIATSVFGLVEQLLGRELAAATTPGADAVRRALTLCPADSPVVVRLHPDDLATLGKADQLSLPATVTVLGDAAVQRGGAIAEAGPRRVDAQLGAALERVRAVLLP